MRKLFIILSVLLISFTSYSQDVTGTRIIAKQSLFVRDRWVDTILVDTANWINKVRSIPTASAIYSFVSNRQGGGGGGSGTVTNIATGLGLSGGPITTTGTILVDTASPSILSRQRAAATYQPIGSYVTGNIYTTDGTLSGNRSVSLNGNTLNFNQGANPFLTLDPSSGAENAMLRAYNTTGGDNSGQIVVNSSAVDAQVAIGAGFNANAKQVAITGYTDATTSNWIYYAEDNHTFTGGIKLNSLAAGASTDSVMVWNPSTKQVGYKYFPSSGSAPFLPTTGTGTATGSIIGDLSGNSVSIQQGGESFLLINPTAGSESSVLRAFNPTAGDNVSSISATSFDNQTQFSLQNSFDGGAKSTSITGFADATTSTLTYTADTHTFNGGIILNSLAAGSTTDSVMVWNASTKAVGYVSPSSLFSTPGIDDVLAVGQDLTANRTIQLNGNDISFLNGTEEFLVLGPSSFASGFFPDDGTAHSEIIANANSAGSVNFVLFSDNGIGNFVQIIGNGVTKEIEYDAPTHFLSGNVGIGVSPTVLFQVQSSTNDFIHIDPSTYNSFISTNDANTYSWLKLRSDTTDHVDFTLQSNNNVNNVVIMGDAQNNNIQYDAGVHTFNYGGGELLLNGTNASSIMRSSDNTASTEIGLFADLSGGDVAFLLIADNNTDPQVKIIGDAQTQSLTYTAPTHTFNGNVIPGTDDTYTLGDDTHRWADIFLGPATAHIGTSTSDEGSLSYNTSTNVLSIASTGTLAITAATTLTGNFLTATNNTYDIGDATNSFKDIYSRTVKLDGSTSGTVTINSDALSNALNSTTLSGAGISPSTMFAIQKSNNSLSDINTVQSVFSSSFDVWTLQASQTYYFRGFYSFTHGATSHSVSMSFATGGAGSISAIYYYAIASPIAVNTVTATQTATFVTQTSATAVNQAGANNAEQIWFSGYITTSSGGTVTVTPQITFSAAPGGSPATLAGSYIQFTPFGTDAVTSLGNVN